MLPSRFAPHSACRLAALLISAGLLAACGSAAKPAKSRFSNAFDSHSPYQQNFPNNEEAVCEAARRTLLSQGYVITETRRDGLRATRVFQPDPDYNMELEFNVSCVPAAAGAIAFASAVQNRYEVKKSSNAAGLSVSALGSISLPWNARSEALVKVASETVTDPALYEGFFSRLEHYLETLPQNR